jgi:hypothetical protein
MSDSLPEYRWGEAPENLRTKRQLAEQGLRPGGPQVATLRWGTSRRPKHAALFDAAIAKPKRQMTAAQRAALEAARAAQRTCFVCQQDVGYVLKGGICSKCTEHLRKAGVAGWARDVLATNPLILDTETTDLYGYLVEISVIDAQGNVLLNTRVNPECEIDEGAQAVHGLTLEMLASEPVFADLEPQLRTLLSGRNVAVYNVEFDRSILRNELRRLGKEDNWLKRVKWRDVMEAYAEWCGDWSDYHGNYRWQPLPGGDHSALGDCEATLAVLREVAEYQKLPNTGTEEHCD